MVSCQQKPNESMGEKSIYEGAERECLGMWSTVHTKPPDHNINQTRNALLEPFYFMEPMYLDRVVLTWLYRYTHLQTSKNGTF